MSTTTTRSVKLSVAELGTVTPPSYTAWALVVLVATDEIHTFRLLGSQGSYKCERQIFRSPGAFMGTIEPTSGAEIGSVDLEDVPWVEQTIGEVELSQHHWQDSKSWVAWIIVQLKRKEGVIVPAASTSWLRSELDEDEVASCAVANGGYYERTFASMAGVHTSTGPQ